MGKRASMDMNKSLDELMKIDKAAGDIITVKYDELHDFPNHPFNVLNNRKRDELAESIRDNGILAPLSIWKRDEGGYYIIAGHTRRWAGRKAGLNEFPAIIENCTMEEAVIKMVDSNIQRDKLLPSEKAFAYRMRLEAQKKLPRQATPGATLNIGLSAAAAVGEAMGDNERAVQRYVRLTYLIPELLESVDCGKLNFMSGVNLSYLTPEAQSVVMSVIANEKKYPSVAQSEAIKHCSEENSLNDLIVRELLTGDKPVRAKTFKVKRETVQEYLGDILTPEEIDAEFNGILEEALMLWKSAHAHDDR